MAYPFRVLLWHAARVPFSPHNDQELPCLVVAFLRIADRRMGSNFILAAGSR